MQLLCGESARKERRQELAVEPRESSELCLGKSDLVVGIGELGQMLGVDGVAPLARLGERDGFGGLSATGARFARLFLDLNEIKLKVSYRVILFNIVYDCRRTFFAGVKYFSNGIVDPPSTSVVNSTMINVVVIITRRASSELSSRCNDSAYEIAPRSPENHIINCIRLVI